VLIEVHQNSEFLATWWLHDFGDEVQSMARPRKTDTPDLSKSHDLKAGLIERLTCPDGKLQAFLRDKVSPSLRVRVTKAGAKSYVFEGKLNRQTIRRTIGDTRAWTIERARIEANAMRVTLDLGEDPRELARDAQAKKAEHKAAALKFQSEETTTVANAWETYLFERRPHWGDLHFRDHVDKAKPGGLPSGRRGGGKKLTQPGPLAALMGMPLRDLNAATIEAWAAREGQVRPSSARLAWRLLTVFLRWCGEQPQYTTLVPDKNPGKTRKVREALGKPAAKADVLQRGQLAAWFSHVQGLQNPVIAAVLQVMLLTGARPGEVLAMRWDDVNLQWNGLTIRDKVEGQRLIPATPYVRQLLANLPRRNEWVFSSPSSATGCLTEPNNPHTRACIAAGLGGLTLHGLRRSFASLTEWLEVPAGVVAQIQGHKPSATAEKHYKVRPLELLAVHHERIEAWVLEQANVSFDAGLEAGSLRAVA
jgi:integrase